MVDASKHQNASGQMQSGQAITAHSEPSDTPGLASRITGWHVWMRQGQHLKKRLTFPLLRQVWKSNLVLSKMIVPHEVVPDEYLRKTLLGHRFLLCFMTVVLLWSGLTTVKGVAAGVLHGMWINNWLLGGVPLCVLAVARLVTSCRVIKGVTKALKQRSTSEAAVKPMEQNT